MTYVDPFDAASDPQLPTPEVWGKAKVEAFFCVLEKGVGAVEFNPASHKIDDRRTNILIDIEPLPASGLNFTTSRKMLRESREWAAIVWPSLKAIGINNLRDLNNQYVQAELVPTGRTYTNNAGETVQATTLKFVALFANEAAANSAYLAAHPDKAPANGKPSQPSQAPAPVAPTAPPTNGGNGNGTEKATALKFLPPLIRKANGDETELAKLIAAMPIIARHYTVKSPEVMKLVDEYLFGEMSKAA